MRVIYYEYMDTACLFIDDSPCVGGISFSFFFSTCVCVHIKTVIWRVHVTGVERWKGGGGGERLTSDLFVRCAAARRSVCVCLQPRWINMQTGFNQEQEADSPSNVRQLATA